ncbi:MAG: glutamate-cysteine ligase family protein, partial [archaeon]
VRERWTGVVEVNSPPSYNLEKFKKSYMDEVKTLTDISELLELHVIPASVFENENISGDAYPIRRYLSRDRLFGEYKTAISHASCGTHLHIDRNERTIDQYNLLQSLDPSFVLLSTSPFLLGKNTYNCHRVHSYRDELFEDYPAHGQLINYFNSTEELDQLNHQRLDDWLGLIGNDEETKAAYNQTNTSWGPIRLRERTIETRNGDANLPSIVMAQAALYKGVNDHVFRNQLNVRIMESQDFENLYGITTHEMILPSYETLKQMEYEGCVYGLESDQVYYYLKHLVDIADKGLSKHEQRYLEPFKIMLNERRNIADVLYDRAISIYPKLTNYINAQTARELNLYMSELHTLDMNEGSKPICEIIRDKSSMRNPKIISSESVLFYGPSNALAERPKMTVY